MIQAAGGVLWRGAPGGNAGDIEIAVVHRPRYDDWSLPKGKLHAGEHPLLGAVREVTEETGLATRVGRRLSSTSYRVAGMPKTVDYWAMEVVGGRFTPGDEVDDLCWLPPDAAKSSLTMPQDPGVVESFLSAAVATTTVLLVRHGRAGSSHNWPGDDALRPLDDVGQQQAVALAELLPVYLPIRVLAADRVRCVDSVRPLAQHLDLPVEVAAEFSEAAHAEEPGRVADRLRDLAGGGAPIVVCSQGGVIPDSVILLAERDRVTLPALAARKGSVWALHFAADQRLVAADYFPRPGMPTAPHCATPTARSNPEVARSPS